MSHPRLKRSNTVQVPSANAQVPDHFNAHSIGGSKNAGIFKLTRAHQVPRQDGEKKEVYAQSPYDADSDPF